MGETYVILRVLAAFFGIAGLLGVIWFANSLDQITLLSGVLAGLASIAAACVPQRWLSSAGTRRLVAVICAVGAVAGSFLVVGRLAAPNDIEWDVVAMDLTHIAVLVSMAAIAIRQG
jgi:hypothetical protein